MKQIPIQNIYYLLSYAWNRLDESDLVDVGDQDFEDLANLLGKVLANGCSYLFKKGLYRNYHEVEEEIPGIRGRLLIGNSVKDLSFHNKRAWCRFDELSHDVLPNQILKATVLRLLRMKEIEDELHEVLKVIHSRFSEIQDINLQLHHFNKVHIHRNNAFYGFLIQVCQLIFESSALEEDGKRYRFRDFTRDPQKMHRLFEAFVKNFYNREQDRYKVFSPNIKWPFKSEVESHNELIPKMSTDIVLEDTDQIIIIDTKFYSETLAKRADFGSVSLKSPNLYQIFAYMQHISNPENKDIAGMLLYPDVGEPINATYTWEDQVLRYATINLGQGWQGIKKDLLDLFELVKASAA